MIILILFIIIFIIALSMIIKAIRQQYILSYYPENVLDSSEFMGEEMTDEYFMELIDIAEELEGKGITLYPTSNNQVFNYSSEVWATLRCNKGSGVIVIAEGSGNIQEDISKYITYYYHFIGNVEPVYTEFRYEAGYDNGYGAEYSSGRLSTGNFFKRKDLHIVALEYTLRSDKKGLFVYATDSYTELDDCLKVLQLIQEAAVKGNGISLVSEEEADLKIENATITVSENTIKEENTDIQSDIMNSSDQEWITAYASAGGLSEDGSPVRNMEGNLSTMECSVTLNQNFERVMFVYQCVDGVPVHAVLFSPNFSTYYKPVRYDKSDGKYYFYVENPVQGMWRGVLQIENSEEYGVLNYYEVSEEEAALFSSNISEYELKDMTETEIEQAETTPEGTPDQGIDLPLSQE